MPVVSANVSDVAPLDMISRASDATSAAGMSPSYGEPNAHDTVTSTHNPPARPTMSATAPSDSAIVRRTLRSLYAGDAEIVTSRPSTPASSAISAPRTLGTSATYDTPGARVIERITSSADAIAGTADGETNDTASISRTPVADKAATSRTRACTGNGATARKPSRGPTPRIRTRD